MAVAGELPTRRLEGLLKDRLEPDGVRLFLFRDETQAIAAAEALFARGKRLRMALDRPNGAALALVDSARDGQVLSTMACVRELSSLTKLGVTVLDLGMHRVETMPSQHVVQLNLSGRPVAFADVRTLERVAHNVPAPTKRFFGRRSELQEIGEALRSGRMVTLVGPGGIGKSRLLVVAAARAAHDFADGVRLVHLADAFDAARIVAAIGRALDIGNVGDAYELVERAQLARRSLLLLLDNCEHLIEASRATCVTLLERCAHLAILSSSREPLGAPGEAIYRVPPLDPHAALELFLDRMRHAGERTPTGAADLQSIASLCDAVDRIPLAIECTAGSIVSIAIPDLAAASLAERLGTLRNRVASDPRHLSLDAAIEWSYCALSPPERDVLLALTLFPAPAAIAAVLAVSATSCNDVEALVQKSLAIAQDDGEKRFTLLETVRRFARERSAAAPDSAVRYERYVAYYLAALTPAYDPLPREAENIEAALSYALELGKRDAALQLAYQLARTWYVRGTPLPARRTLGPLLANDELADVNPELFAALLTVAASLANHRMEIDEAAQYAQRGYDLRRKTGDPRLCESLLGLGIVTMLRHDFSNARRLLEEVLSAPEAGEMIVANAMWNLGLIALSQGDLPRAERMFCGAGDRWAKIAPERYGRVPIGLASLRAEADRLQEARELLARAISLEFSGDDRIGHGMVAINCGDLHLKLEDAVAAMLFYEAGFAMALASGGVYSLVEAFEGLAALSARGEAWRGAAKLLGASSRFRGERPFISEPSIRKRRQELERLLRARLGDAFASCSAEGASLPYDRLSALVADTPLRLEDLQAIFTAQPTWPGLPVATLQRFPKVAVAARVLTSDGARDVLERAADRTIGDAICRAVAARVLHEYGYNDEALLHARHLADSIPSSQQPLAHWLHAQYRFLEERATERTVSVEALEAEGWPQWPRNSAIAALRHARTIDDRELAHDEAQLAVELAAQCGDAAVRSAARHVEREFAAARIEGFRAQSTIRLSVLQQAVFRHGERVDLPDRELELAIALGIHDMPVRRDALLAMIWPDFAAREGANALKTAIYRLRTRLGDPAAVRIADGSYALGTAVHVDVRAYRVDAAFLLSKAPRTPGQRCKLRSLAAAFAEGECPTAARWEWFAPFENELANLERRVGVAAAGDALEAGDSADALAIASGLLRRNPVDEAAMEIVLNAHVQRGEPALAAQALRAFRRLYRNELGSDLPEHLQRFANPA